MTNARVAKPNTTKIMAPLLKLISAIIAVVDFAVCCSNSASCSGLYSFVRATVHKTATNKTTPPQ